MQGWGKSSEPIFFGKSERGKQNAKRKSSGINRVNGNVQQFIRRRTCIMYYWAAFLCPLILDVKRIVGGRSTYFVDRRNGQWNVHRVVNAFIGRFRPIDRRKMSAIGSLKNSRISTFWRTSCSTMCLIVSVELSETFQSDPLLVTVTIWTNPTYRCLFSITLKDLRSHASTNKSLAGN